jgi:cation transport ATPase
MLRHPPQPLLPLTWAPTDAAVKSAGVTFCERRFTCHCQSSKISEATMSKTSQTFLFVHLHELEVRSAAGVLYPFLGLLLSPMIGAAATSFSSLSVT